MLLEDGHKDVWKSPAQVPCTSDTWLMWQACGLARSRRHQHRGRTRAPADLKMERHVRSMAASPGCGEDSLHFCIKTSWASPNGTVGMRHAPRVFCQEVDAVPSASVIHGGKERLQDSLLLTQSRCAKCSSGTTRSPNCHWRGSPCQGQYSNTQSHATSPSVNSGGC